MMASRSPQSIEKPTDQQAVAVFVLWASGHFDTFDIGELLGIGESAVVRLLHAARHIHRGGQP